jgi:hypothetical protein
LTSVKAKLDDRRRLGGAFAETPMTIAHDVPQVHRLGVGRCVATGGLGLPAFYALFWVGAFFAPHAPHRLLNLFSAEKAGTMLSLFEGMGFAMIFGGIAGALIAGIYNALAPIDGR